MAVYVDKLVTWGGDDAPRCFRHRPSCHMYADKLTELHALADKIGLKREWFQNHADLPHYDLTKNKRYAALQAGAVEKDWRFMVRYMEKRREKLLARANTKRRK